MNIFLVIALLILLLAVIVPFGISIVEKMKIGIKLKMILIAVVPYALIILIAALLFYPVDLKTFKPFIIAVTASAFISFFRKANFLEKIEFNDEGITISYLTFLFRKKTVIILRDYEHELDFSKGQKFFDKPAVLTLITKKTVMEFCVLDKAYNETLSGIPNN